MGTDPYRQALDIDPNTDPQHCSALSVPANITEPPFTIVNWYEFTIKLQIGKYCIWKGAPDPGSATLHYIFEIVFFLPVLFLYEQITKSRLINMIQLSKYDTVIKVG